MVRPENIQLSPDDNAVVILDQTQLPAQTVFLTLHGKSALCDAVKTLKVRGAPAIGIFAAFALYVLAKQTKSDEFDPFFKELLHHKSELDATRPTAVNLKKMTDRIAKLAEQNKHKPVSEIILLLKNEAERIQQEDINMCRAISEFGLTLIKDGDGVLTHCNAGPLATSLYGTGLGTILLAQERGLKLHAYCDETRPLLQGARLTAYELQKAGVDVTLICDNMASIVMSQGKINACFTGCDRVAQNGDTANKIGTSGVAVLAKYYGIPFYVFCPSSTIDFECRTGDHIVIEEREPEEITHLFYKAPTAPEAIKCYNPAFDVTHHSLITAIITERGILKPPYSESLAKMKG